MASCGLCDEDSTSSCAAEVEAYAAENEELAAQLAEKDAIIASMTSPPPSPPPPSPPPCDLDDSCSTYTYSYW